MKPKRELGTASFPCPRCLEPGAREDPVMCGSTIPGGKIVYWRCEACGLLFSELTRSRMEAEAASQGRA
jgi:predicted RNA-binding Zn-ribbon protein involved in translation (DUF1610 family)